MRLKIRIKSLSGILLAALFITIILFGFLSFFHPSNGFEKWDSTIKSCGCHIDNSNIESIGNIYIISPRFVKSNKPFVITLQVSGLTEAYKKDPSGDITLGLDKNDLDNALFTNDRTMMQDNLPINANGDSASYSFQVTAPPELGNYNLIAYAVFSDANDDWYYIDESVTITVEG